MESTIKEVTENTDKELNLALKNISILASRPKLTAPTVMLAAVESLVDIVISSGHKEADYYANALQTCWKFENNPDILVRVSDCLEQQTIRKFHLFWQNGLRIKCI